MPQQVIAPRFRGFLALGVHPEGCASQVRRQIQQARASGPGNGLGTVLVIGDSTGFGLASLLTAVWGYGAKALGVCFEREPKGDKTGSAGWYNVAEAHRVARSDGHHIESINGDAFSDAVKNQVIERLRSGAYGPVELVIYSLASPKRKDPDSDTVWSSVLKPIGAPFTGKTINLDNGAIQEVSIPPASPDEIAQTVKVMGGEDWERWMRQLADAGVLAKGCRTVAYSYIGPAVTFPIYRSGTIGKAKEHLEASAASINGLLAGLGGSAFVSVNKALVTQASSAIPVVPLYISLLFKHMKQEGLHEGTIEQITRLFAAHLAPGRTPQVDDAGRIRVDDLEMLPSVQERIASLWQSVDSGNFGTLGDFAGFRSDFERLFGFNCEDIDYAAPVETDRPW
jgi:enoyl-[acyl-carrier protein] reductase/trans-2-enoyl-CoA reductase (NAD+)